MVALFKDEFWHWRHAPGLDVTLEVGATDPYTRVLGLRNPSMRMAAQGVTVRVIDFEGDPVERALRPRWFTDHMEAVDRLLPRASGETTFGIAPQGEVRLPFLQLQDGQSGQEEAVALLQGLVSLVSPETPRVLVSLAHDHRRESVKAYPEAADVSRMPAMIRLEVAADNVPARLYTVTLFREPDAAPGDKLPGNPALAAAVFDVALIEGAQHNVVSAGGTYAHAC